MATLPPTLEPPAAAAPAADAFVFGGKSFRSRLIVGTGKYATFPLMKAALEESGAEIVTVAVRRVNLTDRSKESLLDYVPRGMTLLPNTAGCYNAEDAVRAARLGREVGLSNWVKLEVLGDEQTLWPDNEALLAATATLVKEGLRGLPLHVRRSDRLPPPRGRGRGRGHAARRADRLGTRHPESRTPSRSSSNARGSPSSWTPASARPPTPASRWSSAPREC